MNKVLVASNLDVSKRLKGKVNLAYADIIYERPVAEELVAIAKTICKGGALYVQTDWHSVAEIKVFFDRLDEDLRLMNWIIWPCDWGGRPKNAYARKHDDILYYVKLGKEHTFNADAIKIPKVALINSNKTHKIPTDVWSDIGNFYTTSTERIKDKEGKNVVWQKPEKLLRRIILASSNKGDLVYEPYLGTGTACAVAMSLGRNYIGCDVSEVSVSVAKKRLCLLERKIKQQKQLR